MGSNLDSLDKQLKAEVLIKTVVALVVIDIGHRNSEHTQTKHLGKGILVANCDWK